MLSADLVKKIRQIQIYTSRIVNTSFAGQYESVFKGRGMQFEEVREYVPSDDVRTIDWNVTARAGRPYIKRFTEEREMTVIFLADLSGSGNFGTRGRLKNELAAEFCAVLAFAAIRNNDKVGLILFTDQIELFIPPKKGTPQSAPDPRTAGFLPCRPQDGYSHGPGISGAGDSQKGDGFFGIGFSVRRFFPTVVSAEQAA